ncbi:5326_t:CDS:2 [Paraglomus brasilianum]|uniref:5326_t:CDS:1 n=1 Tax=Paraglomus brasilianum TaxID=144538 RepID=A0A9N9B4I1_9GLOM|nr:5326_t:CDS:2 [Paraglomus brasilianum]
MSTTFSQPSDMNEICYHIEGFLNCSYFHNATQLAEKLKNNPDLREPLKVVVGSQQRDEWGDRLVPNASSHSTSPFIYEGCKESDYKLIGGYTAFVKLARQRHGLDVQHTENDEKGCAGGVCKLNGN